MTRKCRKIEQINTVMEMARAGMISGARAALAVGAATSSATTRKRRKLNSDEHLKFSAGSSFVQLNSRSPVITPPETTLLPPGKSEARCSTLHTDEFPDSCCSSNGSTEQDEETIGFLDLEVESLRYLVTHLMTVIFFVFALNDFLLDIHFLRSIIACLFLVYNCLSFLVFHFSPKLNASCRTCLQVESAQVETSTCNCSDDERF